MNEDIHAIDEGIIALRNMLRQVGEEVKEEPKGITPEKMRKYTKWIKTEKMLKA